MIRQLFKILKISRHLSINCSVQWTCHIRWRAEKRKVC